MKRCAIFLLAGTLAAQTPTAKSFVGTVAGFRPENAEVEIRSDQGDKVLARFTPDTIAQKIASGARDLKTAEAIKVTNVAIGDRVLLTLQPGTTEIRRIVVMLPDDIAKHNEAEHLDWQTRGLAGIVSAKSGNRITLKTRSMIGDTEFIVTVGDHTAFRRYAPDSVKFTNAKPSKLTDVAIGDQLRARGEKSEDGLKVMAQEVVFGTFIVKAGTITGVNREAGQLSLNELGTNKPLTVAVTADSQIKSMPAFPGGMGGGMPGPPGPPTGGRGDSPARGAVMAGPPGGFDINQMLERMPATRLDELKLGSAVIVSSTKPAKSDELTAIMMLANADMLIQRASIMSGGTRGGNTPAGAGMNGPGMGGMIGGDLSNLGLSGILMH